MGQTNHKNGNLEAPPAGYIGIGSDVNGTPVIIYEDGSEVPILLSATIVPNIITNLGIGLEADVPLLPTVGDVYVTSDTFKVYSRIVDGEWNIVDLIDTQFVTDISDGTELPPLYQFFNDIIMPIANQVVDIVLP